MRDDNRLGGAFTRQQVHALAAAIGCVSSVGIGLSLSIPLLSLEMERMGVSSTLIGFNTAVAGLASVLVVPFVPRWASRFGVNALLWTAILGGAVLLLLFKLLFSFAWWLLLRFVFAVCLSTLFVLSEYWINAVAPPRRRGLVMGVYAAVLSFGFSLGPLILVVVGTSGWPPYLTGAALFLLGALPLVVARDLSPGVHGGTGRSVLSLIFTAPTATLAAFVFGAVETGAIALLPIYGLAIGKDAESAATLVSAVALGSILFQVPIGLMSDRIDRRFVLLMSGFTGLLGALSIPWLAHSSFGLYAILTVWGGISVALYTVGLAHLGARFTGRDLVSANAAFVILYNLGLTIGPAVVGLGMDIHSPHGFAYALAGFLGFYVVIAAIRIAAARPIP